MIGNRQRLIVALLALFGVIALVLLLIRSCGKTPLPEVPVMESPVPMQMPVPKTTDESVPRGTVPSDEDEGAVDAPVKRAPSPSMENESQDGSEAPVEGTQGLKLAPPPSPPGMIPSPGSPSRGARPTEAPASGKSVSTPQSRPGTPKAVAPKKTPSRGKRAATSAETRGRGAQSGRRSKRSVVEEKEKIEELEGESYLEEGGTPSKARETRGRSSVVDEEEWLDEEDDGSDLRGTVTVQPQQKGSEEPGPTARPERPAIQEREVYEQEYDEEKGVYERPDLR